MDSKITIAKDFPQPIEVKPGYEAFFEGVKEIVKGKAIDDILGEQLKNHVSGFLKSLDFKSFQDFSETSYLREYLGKDEETGWEAIMMCWKKGNRTAIHGHPHFAAYNFAKGDFLVEVFEDKTDYVRLSKSFGASEGDGFYAVGKPETFDNHIHRITCLSDFGYSLHIYSDDARKGLNMNEFNK